MLERKAVIEARKEYLESLHVKRVSPLFFCFCFFLTCFLSLFETFLITFILDANLSAIHFMFNSQRKHSCFPQEVQCLGLGKTNEQIIVYKKKKSKRQCIDLKACYNCPLFFFTLYIVQTLIISTARPSGESLDGNVTLCLSALANLHCSRPYTLMWAKKRLCQWGPGCRLLCVLFCSLNVCSAVHPNMCNAEYNACWLEWSFLCVY